MIRSADEFSRRSSDEALLAALAKVAAEPARLGAILDEFSEVLVAFSPHRVILAANAGAERYFGYGRDELNGQSTDLLVPVRFHQPDAPPQLATDDLTTVEIPCVRKDGSEVPTIWSYGAVSSGRADPIFVMVVRDLAQVEAGLDSLRRNDARYRSLLLASASIVWVASPAGEFVEPQLAWQEYTGQEWDEYRGSKWISAIHPDDRPHVMEDWMTAVRSGSGLYRTQGRVWSAHHKAWRAFQTRGVRVRGPKGEILEWIGALTDVQDTVEVRERLGLATQSRDLFLRRTQHLQETATQLVRADSLTAIANAFEAVDAKSPVATVGWSLFVRNKDQIDLLAATAGSRQAAGRVAPFPISARFPGNQALKTNTAVWLRDAEELARRFPDLPLQDVRSDVQGRAIIPLRAGDEPIGVLAVSFGDVRVFDEEERAYLTAVADLWAQAVHRARLVEAERDAIRRALEAETLGARKKDEFLAMLGHELRNPLSPIVMSLQRLRMRSVEGRELAVIERQVGHLVRLVDDLLDVSRITRGKIELRTRRIELAHVVREGLETASSLFQRKGQRVDVQVPLAGYPLDADPDRLAQVVANLLTNASRYSAPGTTVTIRAELAGFVARLSVKDEGIGIPKELLAEIFEAFYQPAQSSDRPKGGLGLGLAIVKSLVDLHGGRVWANSDGPGQGSEFTVELPLAAASEDFQSEDTGVPPPLSRVELSAAAASGKRILVVDDNEDAAQSLADLLIDLGHEVQTASGGVDALRIVSVFKPEVCLVDIGLPAMDGYELADRLQKSNELPSGARIIALTGYGQDADKKRTAKAGFHAHLVKPVSFEELTEIVAS